jgi:hypothetical protein
MPRALILVSLNFHWLRQRIVKLLGCNTWTKLRPSKIDGARSMFIDGYMASTQLSIAAHVNVMIPRTKIIEMKRKAEGVSAASQGSRNVPDQHLVTQTSTHAHTSTEHHRIAHVCPQEKRV